MKESSECKCFACYVTASKEESLWESYIKTVKARVSYRRVGRLSWFKSNSWEESGNSSNRDQEPSGSTEGAKKADPVSKDEGPTEVVGTEQVGSEVTDHVDGADPRVGADEVDISDRDGESAHEEHDNNYDGPNILSEEGYALGAILIIREVGPCLRVNL